MGFVALHQFEADNETKQRDSNNTWNWDREQRVKPRRCDKGLIDSKSNYLVALPFSAISGTGWFSDSRGGWGRMPCVETLALASVPEWHTTIHHMSKRKREKGWLSQMCYHYNMSGRFVNVRNRNNSNYFTSFETNDYCILFISLIIRVSVILYSYLLCTSSWNRKYIYKS